MADRILERLTMAFQPSGLRVINESRLHAGHAGSPGNGESHFRVEITSAAFRGKSRVERQRMVYDALRDEMQSGIHALSIVAGEDAATGT